MYKKIGLLLLIVIFISCNQDKHHLTSEINQEWKFKNTKDTLWMDAIVPGTVHTDLLNNQKIEEPFIGNNEEKLQWISDEDWEYTTTFLVDKERLKRKNHQLEFKGLDTYATVFLNDSLLIKTDNAFRTWNVDVSKRIQENNTLRIIFKHPDAVEKQKANKLTYELPVSGRVFTRKPQFHYGWDWGPTFITSGIWRPITLESWDDVYLNDVYIDQRSLTDEKASLQAKLDLNITSEIELTFQVSINDSIVLKEEKEFLAGTHLFNLDFEILNPKRWWTHNLGDPYLYDIKIQVNERNKEIVSKSIQKGLRTIKLVQDKDSFGSTFYFKLNDVPVFMKGANYIPQHIFQSEVKTEDYQQIFKDAIAANMNMLRVWGGGIYEEDIFYDLADKNGVLIWQDFMFACAMYPGDEAFFENVKQEATDNIKRLRNHSSIALWCGNNENNEAWHNWGWQTDRSEEEKEEIWTNYQKLFNGILPEAVASLTDNSYWESSPKYGRADQRFKLEGSAHDWGVWHDALPFERFEEEVPRFMSEYGFQSFPSYEAIKYFTQLDTIDIDHSSFKTHQKHNRGFALIKEYMQRDFPVPTDPEDYVYVSQLLQAYGITKGIHAHRRAMPYNMGSLYWQFNDCWPVVSWSGIDGLGNWKALHYKAKRSFADLIISSRVHKDSLELYAVNDNLKAKEGDLKVSFMDFEGNILWDKKIKINAEANASTKVFMQKIPDEIIDFRNVVVITEFQGEKANFYLVKPKDLKLSEHNVQLDISKVSDGYEITVSSSSLQKDVFLYTDKKGHFEDNFFDLLPGETKKVFFKTSEDVDFESIKVKTLNSVMKMISV
ncbi:beta-mannosidase [Aquimarina litoralis]|uniref:beta-mannosidase n=1 Tax=Aquimarina litoralis TaxID=584605 RepID=UPI001C5A528D|nr:glycoside hydrolase family 2 protein [Aquimarina litoralis]MBW1297267.1 glycoside hydrolase family 2 protein [Aquimarina litoralis]